MQTRSNMSARFFDGVLHGYVSERYNVYDHVNVIRGMRSAIEGFSYEANQAFLSPDKLHMRFVDFDNPITVGNERLFSGCTVQSNNVGSGALVLKYFLYRAACKNGIVWSAKGGTLYRRSHLSVFDFDSGELFSEILAEMQGLNEKAIAQIESATNKKLDAEGLEKVIAEAQKNLHFGKKGREAIEELLETTYDKGNLWGVINAITEASQKYTLDTRNQFEEYAGRLLLAA